MIPQEFLMAYLGANAFALAVLALSFWRRDVARWIGAGVFAWAAVTNAAVASSSPAVYLDYATLTPSTWYREFILGWFSAHVQVFVFAIAAGQVVIAALLISRRSVHQWICAAGSWIFLAAIAPLGIGSGFPFSLTFGVALLVSLKGADVRSPRVRQVVYWIPRVVGFGLVAGLVLLSLDAFAGGQTAIEMIVGVGMHLLPAFVMLGIVVLASRWGRIGGTVFFALAVGYGFMVNGRVSWMLVISLPLVIEGVFFLWSGRLDRATRPAHTAVHV